MNDSNATTTSTIDSATLLLNSAERRSAEFQERVIAELNEAGCDLSHLANSPHFTAAFNRATRIAVESAEPHKFETVRRLLVNIASSTDPIPVSTIDLFLTCIDHLSGRHLQLLQCLDNPKLWLASHPIKLPADAFARKPLAAFLLLLEPQWATPSFFLVRAAFDWQIRGLILSADFQATMSSDDLVKPKTTELGKQFVRLALPALTPLPKPEPAPRHMSDNEKQFWEHRQEQGRQAADRERGRAPQNPAQPETGW